MTPLQNASSTTQPTRSLDELILVVKRSTLLATQDFQGFLPCNNFTTYEQLITQNQEFIARSEAEQDPRYKQIIPYLVFTHNGRYFLMQRKSTASEQRLKNKLSLGIGGHIRQEDITNTSLVAWASREFTEEINYNGSYTTQALGIINDDSNDVGKVHIGFVFLLTGNSDAISIRSELKSGTLIPLEECINQLEAFETWSQLVITALQKGINE